MTHTFVGYAMQRAASEALEALACAGLSVCRLEEEASIAPGTIPVLAASFDDDRPAALVLNNPAVLETELAESSEKSRAAARSLTPEHGPWVLLVRESDRGYGGLSYSAFARIIGGYAKEALTNLSRRRVAEIETRILC